MARSNDSRPRARAIQIWRQDASREHLLAVRRASSLKGALADYYAETLKPHQLGRPVYAGNTMNVGGATYVAREA